MKIEEQVQSSNAQFSYIEVLDYQYLRIHVNSMYFGTIVIVTKLLENVIFRNQIF